MARYEHLAVFQDIYLLTLEVYHSVSHFKKEHKYTLGEKLKLTSHEMIDLVMIANAEKDKLKSLKKLDQKTESLRIYLRLAHDLKIISGGRLGDFNRKLEEVKKQVGGWQKWATKNN